ncbi:right-handed parallel beta-helix repeat-containing protein [Pseudonocardia sichuanensis]
MQPWKIRTVVGALALLVGGCATPTPELLPRHDVPAREVVDPAAPCSRPAPAAPAATPAARTEAADVDARFDLATRTITLSGGENVSLPALSEEIADPDALREVGPGEWLLGADLVVRDGASLRISAPEVRWLKMASGEGVVTAIRAFGGGVDIAGSCLTSWDHSAGTVDEEYRDGRSFILARDGARLTIDAAEIRYLGSGDVESYGLSWRTEGTTGSITGSVVSHLYYGLYSYEVTGLQVLDNEFHDNVLYGIDPHTHSTELVIERNVVHHNGKHGIILAEHCTDSVVRDNVVYANQHHGIVMYLGSDRNLIEGNESFGNAAQGININESNENTIRGNQVYDNTESGVGLTQTSRQNLIEANHLRGNEKDGIRIVSLAAASTVRGNTIGGNGRYGIYVDTEGPFDLVDNVVFGSKAGLMVRGREEVDEDDNEWFGNTEDDILSS